MFLLIKKLGRACGILLIIFLILIFTFLYFEVKRIERLMAEIETISLSIQINSKKPAILIPASLSQNNEISIAEETTPSLSPELESTLPEKQLNNRKIIHLPILIYHHIDFLSPGASKQWQDLTVSPQTFENQMAYLFEQNYQPITFRQFIDFMEKGEELPEKSLIITFDDGWKNQYLYAFPILKKYNFPATFFIVANYVGGNSFMNWKELKKLLNSGMEIGSHTLNHSNLKEVTSPYLISEIKDSKSILEEKLNYRIDVFAYPYGIFDSEIIEVVVTSGYKAARTISGRVDQDVKNMYTLGGITIYDNLYQFKKIFPLAE